MDDDFGERQFLGRLDAQIKIRGYRIEPGEIIARLDRYPGVEASTVAVTSSAAGPALVAYIVPAWDAELNAGDLREFLAERLHRIRSPRVIRPHGRAADDRQRKNSTKGSPRGDAET